MASSFTTDKPIGWDGEKRVWQKRQGACYLQDRVALHVHLGFWSCCVFVKTKLNQRWLTVSNPSRHSPVSKGGKSAKRPCALVINLPALGANLSKAGVGNGVGWKVKESIIQVDGLCVKWGYVLKRPFLHEVFVRFVVRVTDGRVTASPHLNGCIQNDRATDFYLLAKFISLCL